MDGFALVTQASDTDHLFSSHLSPASLLPELALLVAVYGKCFDDAANNPPTGNEVIWILQTHKKLAIAFVQHNIICGTYYSNYCVEANQIDVHVLDTHVVSGMRIRRDTSLSWYGTRCTKFIASVANRNETAPVDVASTFRILKRRFDTLDPTRSVQLARKATMNTLVKMFGAHLAENPVFLEKYLCGSVMAMGLVTCEIMAGHIQWPLFPTHTVESSEEVLEGITNKCHEYLAMLTGMVKRME